MFKKIDLTCVVIVPREEYDRLKRAVDNVGRKSHVNDALRYLLAPGVTFVPPSYASQIAAAKRADATAPRDEREAFVRRKEEIRAEYSAVGPFEATAPPADPPFTGPYPGVIQFGGYTPEPPIMLDLTPGKYVCIIDKDNGYPFAACACDFYDHDTNLRYSKYVNEGHKLDVLSYYDMANGMKKWALYRESKLPPDAPAPAPGAFLSVEEDRELVAMGREIGEKFTPFSFRCVPPIGAICTCQPKQHISDGVDDRLPAFAPTPANAEHLTDAARALLRRVRDERKQATNG